ncbi:type 2 lantipeptide synthetase LanM [Kroppenstedtia pulmonis]|uniref:Type 2 lantipeptide synthetase LanM n=1 Tax=Kroppenstedtia pulmonis TaxID=1380685 RepID=A0A7D4CHJ2_9BACL|nr:type 2 lanthipeptide synthetase LanM [Kroppenstedtia pulmonis]QKG85534.1 type 2 lantipeptide synthetase LanM [Kroppenstedtia pulmonis]
MYTMAVGECWKGALFLSERTNNNSFITVEGQKRLEQWKKLIQCEYLTLDECLSIEGINSRQLCQMLSSKEEYLENEQTFRLDWVEGLNEIISGKYDDVHIPEVPINPFFYSFLKRFLQYAYQNLIKKLMTTKQVTILTPQIVQNLLTELANELSSISTRTLVLELNVARVSGRLHGNTSEDRLKYYVDVLLKDKDYLARLLQEYSVLSRLLITRTKFWIRNILDLIGRFGADFNTLEGFFGKGKLGKLARIQIQGIGDSHHEGRSVGILTFASGTKLVYKPRSLEVDLQFNDLIQTINDWGLRYPLKTAVTFNRGNYGWMEFIKEIECNTPQEIKKFYWRMGSYLAILYTLNAVDFHYENIIAAGEFPIIVDLETLLHNNSRFQSDNTAYQNAQDLIRQSVLSIGLLPGAFWEKGNRKGIDMSGLGGQEGQVHPIKSPVLTDFYKDTAHIKGKYLTLSLKNNQARYKGRVINSEDFMDDIIIGFTETYQLLKNHKEMLTTEIKKFANIEVRQILRPTQRYSSLRNISFHPDFLRDGLDREMILHKLWIDYSVYRDLKQVICSEKKDMLLGDIPIFNSKPGQRHLLDSRKKVLYNFFPYSALDASLKKINNLSLVDCEQQVRYIRSAMCRLKESSIKNSEEKIYSIKYCNSYNRNAFLKEAIHIGEYILDTAITGNYKGEKDLCWIGYGSINDQESESGVSPVGTSLYEGVLGIALF